MARGLSIQTFVDITTAIAAGGVLRTDFGTGLIMTLEGSLSAGGPNKGQSFRDHAAVLAAVGAGAAARAAEDWFAIEGARNVTLARWAEGAVATTLRGGDPGSISDLAVANAAFVVDGAEVTVDLSSETTYADLASAIQAEIRNGALNGTIGSVDVTDGGTGYAAGDSVTFGAAPANGRDATGTLVVASGVITGITITDGGAGYLVAPSITIGGSGTGAMFTVNLGRDGVTADLTGATFSHTNGRFFLSVVNPVDIGSRLGSPSSGTDISDLLGMGEDSTGVEYLQGHSQETINESVAEVLRGVPGSTPVALMIDDDVLASTTLDDDDRDVRTALAAFAQAGDYVFGLIENDEDALVAGDTTTHAALAFSRQQDHVEPIYSKTGTRPDISLLALMSSQNLNNPASIITPHLKALPGAEPTPINETQRAELERKRTNVYTTVGGLPALVGGFTGKGGSWLDAVWWLLWLKNEMELNIFNAQRASRRFNTAILTDTIAAVMRTAVQSGGVQPGGRVSSSVKQDIIQTTGNAEFDGTLTSGHITWVESPAARSDLDRENRIGRFKIWIAPADVIHKVYGTIILSS